VRNSNIKGINLAEAVKAAPQESGSQLTFAELANAHAVAVCDGSDLRLRKWLDAYGTVSAWLLSSEQIEAAAQAMIDHGYSPSTVNRDIGTIGSVYKWAKIKRLCPRGFRSPSLGVRRYEEKFDGFTSSESNWSSFAPDPWPSQTCGSHVLSRS